MASPAAFFWARKGKSGRVTLPISVFVSDAKREKVANDKVRIDVDVAIDNPIGYFSIVRSVTFNIPEGTRPGEYEVYVGFDRNMPGRGMSLQPTAADPHAPVSSTCQA